MRFNADLYVTIWFLNLLSDLLFIFWASPNINPLLLIKSSLNSSPLINFELTDNQNSQKTLYGPFLLWPGRIIIDEIKGETDEILSKETNISKIYGKYFYYEKYQIYEELLNNGNIIKNNEQCKDGYQNCGIIDTLNQSLCLPTNIECPINDIEIISYSNSTKDDYFNQGYNFEYGSNNMIFFYTNKQKTNPIIGRIILNGNQPCASPEEYCWEKFESYEANESSSCINDYEGNLYDDTYSQFGSISYNILYKENLLSKDYDVFNKNLLESKKLYLFKNRFIGIDKECLNKSNFNKMSDLDYPFYKVLLLPALSVVFNLIVILLILRADLCLRKDESPRCELNFESHFNCIEYIYAGYSTLFTIFYLCFFIGYNSRRTDFNCSDDIINNKVYLFNKQILGIRISSMIHIVLWVIFSIIAICRIYYKKKYKRNIFDALFFKINDESNNDDNSDILEDNNDPGENDYNDLVNYYNIN